MSTMEPSASIDAAWKEEFVCTGTKCITGYVLAMLNDTLPSRTSCFGGGGESFRDDLEPGGD